MKRRSRVGTFQNFDQLFFTHFHKDKDYTYPTGILLEILNICIIYGVVTATMCNKYTALELSKWGVRVYIYTCVSGIGQKIIKWTVCTQWVHHKITTRSIQCDHQASCMTVAWAVTPWKFTGGTVRCVLLFLDALATCRLFIFERKLLKFCQNLDSH